MGSLLSLGTNTSLILDVWNADLIASSVQPEQLSLPLAITYIRIDSIDINKHYSIGACINVHYIKTRYWSKFNFYLL